MSYYEPYPRSEQAPQLSPRAPTKRDTLGAVAGSALTPICIWDPWWHLLRDQETCTGLFETNQIVLLAVLMASLAARASVWRCELGVVVGASVALTGIWVLDLITVRDSCVHTVALWPIGAAMLLVGAVIGLGLVALASRGCALFSTDSERARPAVRADISSRSDGGERIHPEGLVLQPYAQRTDADEAGPVSCLKARPVFVADERQAGKPGRDCADGAGPDLVRVGCGGEEVGQAHHGVAAVADHTGHHRVAVVGRQDCYGRIIEQGRAEDFAAAMRGAPGA